MKPSPPAHVSRCPTQDPEQQWPTVRCAAKGRAMPRKLMGDAYADKLDKGLYTDPFMEKFAEITQEAIFGTVWTVPGLISKPGP